MKLAVKWLVWLGAVAVLASFFLPSVQKDGVAPAPLFEVAQQPGRWVVFAVEAGAGLVILLGLVSVWRQGADSWWRLGQALSLAISELGALAASLQRGLPPGDIRFVAAPGTLVLAGGYLAIIVGLVAGIFMQDTGRRAADTSVGTRLEVLHGEASSPVSLNGSEFSLGRSRRNQLVLREDTVSGVHARLRQARGEWFIQDQDSCNGTYVNDRKIQAQRLRDGDRIRIGSTVLVFRWRPETHASRNSR